MDNDQEPQQHSCALCREFQMNGDEPVCGKRDQVISTYGEESFLQWLYQYNFTNQCGMWGPGPFQAAQHIQEQMTQPWHTASRILSSYSATMLQMSVPSAIKILATVLKRQMHTSATLTRAMKTAGMATALQRIAVEGQEQDEHLDKLADKFIARMEDAEGKKKDAAAVLFSARRLIGYIIQKAAMDPKEIIEHFYSVVVPHLEKFEYGDFDKGLMYIIPDSQKTFAHIAEELEFVHDGLVAYSGESDVDSVISEVRDYYKNLQPAGTPTDGLVRRHDPASALGMLDKVLPPEESVADTAPTSNKGDADTVIKNLPTIAKEPEYNVDTLLDQWGKAADADKPVIEKRIQQLHKGLLNSFLKIAGLSQESCECCE